MPISKARVVGPVLAFFRDVCRECGGELLDVGDELVCRLCGVVRAKEIVDSSVDVPTKAVDYSGQSLGGYLGPIEYGQKERFSKGLASSSTSFGYLKLVSDFAGREASAAYSSLKFIERVSEKLGLPRAVRSQAMFIAKKLYSSPERVRANAAAVSAFSIITACKVEGVTSVGVREIVETHRLMGRKVRFAALVKLTMDSPFRSEPRRAEEYVPRMISRLSSNDAFADALRGEGTSPGQYFARLREAAMISLSVVEEHNRGGHSPVGIAAASVYAGEALLASLESRELRLTQRRLAEYAGVAEYTVREQYGELFRPRRREALIKAIQIQRR